MLVLSMSAFCGNAKPTVLLNQADYFSNFHGFTKLLIRREYSRCFADAGEGCFGDGAGFFPAFAEDVH